MNTQNNAPEASAAWQEIAAVIAKSSGAVKVLAGDDGAAALAELELTEQSHLGAVIAHAGAITVDGGWLKILGSGVSSRNPEERLGGLAKENADADETGIFKIAYDVLGGIFAIDTGGIGAGDGEICYFAPEELMWEGLEIGYEDFLIEMLSGASEEFYETQRWPGWQKETSALGLGQGFIQYPFPFSEEAQEITQVQRNATKLTELHELYTEIALQLRQD